MANAAIQYTANQREVYPKLTDLVDLDTGILADDSSTTARSVQQYPVKSSHNLGELSSIVTAHDDVLASQSMYVGSQTLRPRLIRVVGKDHTGVLQEGRDIGGLSTGGRSHIQYTFLGLRSKSDDGQEGRGGLKHVVTSEVFRGGSDRYAGLEHLETDFGPLADRLEVDTSVDQRLSEITTTRSEGVGSDSDGPRSFVGFEEGKSLCSNMYQREV